MSKTRFKGAQTNCWMSRLFEDYKNHLTSEAFQNRATMVQWSKEIPKQLAHGLQKRPRTCTPNIDGYSQTYLGNAEMERQGRNPCLKYLIDELQMIIFQRTITWQWLLWQMAIILLIRWNPSFVPFCLHWLSKTQMTFSFWRKTNPDWNSYHRLHNTHTHTHKSASHKQLLPLWQSNMAIENGHS